MLASVSGLALTAQIGSGQAVINSQLTLESIAAAVIAGVSIKGGVGRVEMVTLGAILLLTLTDAMDLLRIDPRIQAIFLGLLSCSRWRSMNFRNGGQRLSDVSISGVGPAAGAEARPQPARLASRYCCRF